MRPIAEWTAPTAGQFLGEILPLARPAVLRGAVADWPLVIAGRDSIDRVIAMLAARASAAPVDVLLNHPGNEGRFHYTPDGRALNFVRRRGHLPTFLAVLREQASVARPPAMAVQGLLAERQMPGFAESHPMPLVPAGTEARLWIGNAAKVATHNDPTDNVAAVVAGRRRFTLFPPDAEDDLYMGPAHPTPAGAPVSMVHVTMPDLARYPRFAAALEAGEEAELSPGDAIFIPRDWFHHVESLDTFNMLANYWWDSSAGR